MTWDVRHNMEKGFDNYFRMPLQIKTEMAENANTELGTEQFEYFSVIDVQYK